MKLKKEKYLMKFLLLFSLLIFTPHAWAQSINITNQLSFGEFVLVNNATIKAITFNPDESYSAHADYIFFIDPELGEVQLSSYPALTTLNITIGHTALTATGSGGNFLTSNHFTIPSTITTDINGDAFFKVGASLKNDGGGGMHDDGVHDGIFSVTVTP